MATTTLSGSAGAPLLINAAPFINSSTVTAGGATVVGAASITSTPTSDTVTALSSNITVNGGAGKLTFVGGTGDASVEGGSGSVTLFGGTGGVTATGGTDGNNYLQAGSGAATLFGGGSNSILYAGSSVSDVLHAGEGNQTLVGSTSTTGQDLVYLGKGSDTFIAGAGNASVLGGGGQNTYEFLANMTSKNATVSIGDFHVGSDRLVISGYGTSTDSVFNSKTVSAGSTMLTLGDGTKVVLTGVTNLDRNSLS